MLVSIVRQQFRHCWIPQISHFCNCNKNAHLSIPERNDLNVNILTKHPYNSNQHKYIRTVHREQAWFQHTFEYGLSVLLHHGFQGLRTREGESLVGCIDTWRYQ